MPEDEIVEMLTTTDWQGMFSLKDIRLYPFVFTFLLCIAGGTVLLVKRTTSLFKVGFVTGIALAAAQFSDIAVSYAPTRQVAANWDRLLCLGFIFYLPLLLHTMLLLVEGRNIVRILFFFYAIALILSALYPLSINPHDFDELPLLGFVNQRTNHWVQVATLVFMSITGFTLTSVLWTNVRKYRRSNPAKHLQIRLAAAPSYVVTVFAFITQLLMPMTGHGIIPALTFLGGCTYPTFIFIMIFVVKFIPGDDLLLSEIRSIVSGNSKTLEIAASATFDILYMSAHAKRTLAPRGGTLSRGTNLERIFPANTGEFKNLFDRIANAESRHRKLINAFESCIIVRDNRKLDVLISVYLHYEEDGKKLKFFVITIVDKPKAREEIEARDKERERIGQDLHDGILNPLKAVRDQLHAIQMHAPNQHALAQLTLAERDLQAICDEVRAVSSDLTPVVVEKFGLVPALDQIKYELGAEGIHMDIHVAATAVSLDHQLEKHLFRIVQELSSNSRKHARATTIDLRLDMERDLLTLTFQDNGSGFDTTRLYASRGNGWYNIRNRINLLGGQLEIDSRPGGGGTVVLIEVPISEYPYEK